MVNKENISLQLLALAQQLDSNKDTMHLAGIIQCIRAELESGSDAFQMIEELKAINQALDD